MTVALANLILLLNTLFLLYCLIQLREPNIFSQLDVPFGISTYNLREIILAAADGRPLSRTVEQLLTRMSSLETRTLYIRFGHSTVATCEHCSTFTDYALFALPSFLMSYLREAVVLGFVTIQGTGRERWRTLSIALLVVMAIAEAYWLSTVDIKIPPVTQIGGIIPWHDNLKMLRQLVFMLVPLVVYFVAPPTPPITPGLGFSEKELKGLSPAAAQQFMNIQSVIAKIHLLKYTRGSIARDPALASASREYWTQDKQEGEWIREDPTVQDVARKTGLGFDGIKQEEWDEILRTQNAPTDDDRSILRRNARFGASSLLKSFMPSPYWQPPAADIPVPQ